MIARSSAPVFANALRRIGNSAEMAGAALNFVIRAAVLVAVVGVIGVGVFLHESLGAFVFAACLLTIAVASAMSSRRSGGLYTAGDTAARRERPYPTTPGGQIETSSHLGWHQEHEHR